MSYEPTVPLCPRDGSELEIQPANPYGESMHLD